MMNVLETSYGALSDYADLMTYDGGAPKSCRLNDENRLQTSVGEIIPQYRMAELGERQKKDRRSLSFFESGRLKSASLDEATPLQTPLGVFNAEAVSFYEDGALNRLFPLNGQIDGYWSEKNEGALAESLAFDLPVGQFRAKIISLHFYPSGALKSLTLWPGERITIKTPIGPVKAFDAEMLGMNADQNSVQFSPAGQLRSVKTIHTGIRVMVADQVEKIIEPFETTSLIDINEMRTVPMQIEFAEGMVKVVAQHTHRFDLSNGSLATFERERVIREACASCAGCDGGDSCCQN
jgi:hypothetical protein